MRPGSFAHGGAPGFPLWMIPNMDFSMITEVPLLKLFRTAANLSFLDIPLSLRDDYCPFIRLGSIAVAWHGGVSPCPPLMHTYSCYIRNRKKKFIRCEFGILKDKPLKGIWMDSAFEKFRKRVIDFDFPPCTDCGGCYEAETNETDCYNNPFPVCGDCFWAKGVLRCA
jgi:MoaA/NifB/PqqE/SkfB family radical SAM enzyme